MYKKVKFQRMEVKWLNRNKETIWLEAMDEEAATMHVRTFSRRRHLWVNWPVRSPTMFLNPERVHIYVLQLLR